MSERDAGSLVLQPLSRGPDGFYTDMAEADVFETWADVARRYRLDADWTAITGYSMGGGGTYKLLARWPDLFSRAMAGGAIPGVEQLDSYRNTPLMTWIGGWDEGTPIVFQELTVREMLDRGLRFVWRTFPLFEHAAMGENDEYADAAAFLGPHTVDRDPTHVTYVVDPQWTYGPAGLEGDHAYWLSALELRDGHVRGRIDVRSEAFGAGDPEPSGLQSRVGAMEGGTYSEPAPYIERWQEWGPVPAAPERNRLVVVATNIASVTVDAGRARVGCDTELEVTTDGPVTIELGGCRRTLKFS